MAKEEKKIVKREVKREKKKKSKKQKLAGFLIFLLIIGGIAGFLLFFPSCGILDTMTQGFSTRYEFSSQYKASSKYESNGYLDSISINWRDGSVNFYTHDSDEILIEEIPNETITDKFMMHYNYKETDKYGHYILVQYCKSGKWNFGNLKKDLNVYVPSKEDLKVNIHTYNATINFDLGETKLSELQVQSNHGNVEGIFSSADKVRLLGSNSKNVDSSYSFKVTQTGVVDDFKYSASQGMDLKINEANYINGATVWGKTKLEINKAKEVEVSLARYTLDFIINDIKKIKLNDKYSNGGTVNLYFNSDASYNIDITRKQYKDDDGNVVDMATSYSIGEKISDNNYKIGEGKNNIEITIAGELNLLLNE
jgi:hypothetical protein